MKSEENKIRFYHKQNIETVQGSSFHSFPMHSHRSYCLGIVTDGHIRLKFNQDQILLSKNDGYFIPPYTEHAILSVNNKPYHYYVVCIPDIFPDDCRPEKPAFFDASMGKNLQRVFQSFEKSKDCVKLSGDILNFVTQCPLLSTHTRRTKEREFILKSADYIQKHLDEPFHLQQLCSVIHVTKYHLVRSFKEQLGVTPYHYYVQEKLRSIRKDLLKGRSAEDLAYDYCFADQSHFCNTFKKYIGVTPGRYQESCSDDTVTEEPE